MDYVKNMLFFSVCSVVWAAPLPAQQESHTLSCATKAAVAAGALGAAGYVATEYILHKLRDHTLRTVGAAVTAPSCQRVRWQEAQRWCQRLIIASLLVGGLDAFVRRPRKENSEQSPAGRAMTREEFEQCLVAKSYSSVGMTEEEVREHAEKEGEARRAQLVAYARAGEIGKFVDLATYKWHKNTRVVTEARLKRAGLECHPDKTANYADEDRAVLDEFQKRLNNTKDATSLLGQEEMTAMYDLLYGTWSRKEAATGN